MGVEPLFNVRARKDTTQYSASLSRLSERIGEIDPPVLVECVFTEYTVGSEVLCSGRIISTFNFEGHRQPVQYMVQYESL